MTLSSSAPTMLRISLAVAVLLRAIMSISEQSFWMRENTALPEAGH
jgi:hypothetical protein